MLATVHEITQKVVAERRVEVLRDLGVQAVESSAEETCRAAAEILDRHGKDVPFALLYLVDADGRQLGSLPPPAWSPTKTSARSSCGWTRSSLKAWPLAAVFRRRETVTVTNLGARFKVVSSRSLGRSAAQCGGRADPLEQGQRACRLDRGRS